jgi:iron complex outermembrane recepter protein
MGTHIKLDFTRRGVVWAILLTILADRVPTSTTRAEENADSPEAARPSNNKPQDPEGILNLDIEQLGKVDVRAPQMNVEVTSVSKQESTVGRSPAAVYVITSEMISRSGANNVPDLSRLGPGLEVARIKSHTWAVSARGLTDCHANRMLVLIDGRNASPYNITEIERSVFGKITWRY